MVVGVALLVLAVLLLYFFTAYMFGFPLIFNILGESNVMYYMSAQLGIKWSFIIAIAGAVLGVVEILSSKKAATYKVNWVSILYLVVEIVILFAIII